MDRWQAEITFKDGYKTSKVEDIELFELMGFIEERFKQSSIALILLRPDETRKNAEVVDEY